MPSSFLYLPALHPHCPNLPSQTEQPRASQQWGHSGDSPLMHPDVTVHSPVADPSKLAQPCVISAGAPHTPSIRATISPRILLPRSVRHFAARKKQADFRKPFGTFSSWQIARVTRAKSYDVDPPAPHPKTSFLLQPHLSFLDAWKHPMLTADRSISSPT